MLCISKGSVKDKPYLVIALALTKGERSCGDPTENRTRVTAVKGRCLNRLTMGPDWLGWQDSNLRIQQSKCCVLPLDDTPSLFRSFSCRTFTYRNSSWFRVCIHFQRSFSVPTKVLSFYTIFSYKTFLRDFSLWSAHTS